MMMNLRLGLFRSLLVAVAVLLLCFTKHTVSAKALQISSCPSLLTSVRGGASVLAAEDTLRKHLEATPHDQRGKFHVQGWRWHTMSIMREAERLQTLARHLEQSQQEGNPLETLQKGVDYVVGFNLGALHRVEGMFFPWCRKKINQYNSDPNVKKAFDTVMDHLEKDQRKIAEIGSLITRTVEVSFKAAQKNPNAAISHAAHEVVKQAGAMVDVARSMLEKEVAVVIPTIGRHVPEADQKKFNNQVIKVLGVFDSRCHLVHMHEVVELTKSKAEAEMWKENIPSLPRSLIPRWKRTLYEPKAGVLNLP